MAPSAISSNMNGQNAIVLGAGISGIAATRLLHGAGAKVTLVDDHKSDYEIGNALNLDGVNIVGDGMDHDLDGDFLVLSPGIASDHELVTESIKNNRPVLSEIALAAKFTNAPIMAVTGSNGKSTVVTILHQMMAAGGFRSFLGGNIGTPFSLRVEEEAVLKPILPVHVLEISSFQAEHLDDFSPVAAIFLNLTPDHLNRYDGMQAYGEAKLHIMDRINADGWVIYNDEDEFFRTALADHPQSIPFGPDCAKSGRFGVHKEWIVAGRKKLIRLTDLALPGPHNVSNFLAAATAALLMGVDLDAIGRVMGNFHGLAHRLELVATINDVPYYNDSKATNVGSTIVALKSFESNIVLILGGSSKDADYSDLRELIGQRVRHLITYGEVGLYLADQFQGIVPLHYEENFSVATRKAHDVSQTGDTVLLSPACASFDQFVGFAQRGEAFRQIVENFPNEATRA